MKPEYHPEESPSDSLLDKELKKFTITINWAPQVKLAPRVMDKMAEDMIGQPFKDFEQGKVIGTIKSAVAKGRNIDVVVEIDDEDAREQIKENLKKDIEIGGS